MRNDKGERVYSADQIRHLQRTLSPQDIDPTHAKLIAPASSGDIPALTGAMEQALVRDGLLSFVPDTFAPLTRAVGELRAGGRLQIFGLYNWIPAACRTDHQAASLSTNRRGTVCSRTQMSWQRLQISTLRAVSA